jgi:uncharacterized protein
MMMPEVAYSSFLGTGWSFPPEFARESGEVVMVSEEEDIRSSLEILFGTGSGERLFYPEYGLDTRELLFEPMSTTLKTELLDRVRIAILIYEPRIDLVSLEIDTTAGNDGRLRIILEYRVKATNSRYNLVYPFSITDGNEILA